MEEAGYSVWFQDWDFRGNFVEHMNRAHAQACRTLAVLSDNYFGSDFTLAEWSARFVQDSGAREDRLVPVTVGPLSGGTILDPIAYADLTGCDEAEARRRLLERVKRALDSNYRAKPATPPGFPGGPGRNVPQKPRFPSPIHNLPPHNPDFVGREEELEKLLDLLSADQPVVLKQVLTGLGGIGKTQTALAYAYRHLADCRLVWWLMAETLATLAADYAAMAEHLTLSQTADQPKQIEAVRRALEDLEGWLLIFDNVDDPAVVRDYFPRRGDGRVLLTSRRTDWRGIAKSLPLDVLPEADAVALLSSGAEIGTDGWAELIAEDLGFLPLALTQARAYVIGAGLSFANYRALLAKRRKDLLRRGVPADHKLPLLLTWGLRLRRPRRSAPRRGPSWSYSRSSHLTRCRARRLRPRSRRYPSRCAIR